MAGTAHITLGELQARVARALDAAFPLPVWVTAEIADLRVNGAGHCYMELVEKGVPVASGAVSGAISGGAVPKASARAVAWRGTWRSLATYFRGVTGSDVAAGMKVLVKVTVSYHELYGFSLVVGDIDPSYTLGEAQRARAETIARLQSEGVYDINRGLDLPFAAQRVAVVSSSGAAGWRDFTQELARAPWRFEVEIFEAVMQGHATEDSVVAALEVIAARADEFDVVAIIRGGGSQTDLAAFDGYRLSAHIAQFPLPVVTGIGHDKDRSVADMVAAVELKTPTAVAVWLAEGLGRVWDMVEGLQVAVARDAGAVLERARLRLERASRGVSMGAVEMTRRLEMRLQGLSGELVRRSGEYCLREGHRLSIFGSMVRERPVEILARQARRLEGFEREVASRRPENIMALGFAIVRPVNDGVVGRAVIDPAALGDGQRLDITLLKGRLGAQVEK